MNADEKKGLKADLRAILRAKSICYKIIDKNKKNDEPGKLMLVIKVWNKTYSKPEKIMKDKKTRQKNDYNKEKKRLAAICSTLYTKVQHSLGDLRIAAEHPNPNQGKISRTLRDLQSAFDATTEAQVKYLAHLKLNPRHAGEENFDLCALRREIPNIDIPKPREDDASPSNPDPNKIIKQEDGVLKNNATRSSNSTLPLGSNIKKDTGTSECVCCK